MKLDNYTMSVHPGAGIVGRFPSAVFLLIGADLADAPDDEELIGLVSAVPRPDDLDVRLAELLARRQPPDACALAAVLDTGNGLSLYLHGPVEITADSANAQLVARGAEAGRLERYDAPPDLDSLVVRAVDEQSDHNGSTLSVRAGVVSGRQLVLRRADLPLAAGAQPATTPPPAPDPPATPTGHSMPGPATPAYPAEPALPPPPFDLAFDADPVAAASGSRQSAAIRTRPTFGGRVAARVLVAATAGLALTGLLGLVLPVGFATAADTYTMLLVALGLLTALGALLWDTGYTLLQRRRAHQDWPAPFVLAQAVPEAAVGYAAYRLLLDELIVDDIALAVHVGLTAVVLAAGTLVLRLVPGLRRLVTRAQDGPMPAAGQLPAELSSPMTEPPVTADRPARSGPSGNGASGDRASMVWGVNCQHGHFNRPDARYCGSCGTAMHGLTRQPRQAPRPALGYLVADDGMAVVLDYDYVLGHAPESDASVRSGRARALPLADPAGQLGASHTEVRLDEWDVTVVDLGSQAGTYLREPDTANWVRLAPDRPFTILPGTQLRIGQRGMTFHGANHR